jgi:hypothetical protein
MENNSSSIQKLTHRYEFEKADCKYKGLPATQCTNNGIVICFQENGYKVIWEGKNFKYTLYREEDVAPTLYGVPRHYDHQTIKKVMLSVVEEFDKQLFDKQLEEDNETSNNLFA